MSADDEAAARRRRFLVTWRDGCEPRGIHAVGCLTEAEDYRFAYLSAASHAPGFRPFPGFPRLNEVYRSPRLFLFFASRLMDPRRPDFQEYVRALDLPPDPTQLDLLSRSEGVVKGDRIAVVEEPQVQSDGSSSHVFVVRGVRFAAPDPADRERRLGGLVTGTPLVVRRDVGNPVNGDALQILTESGEPIGWVPDALVRYVGAVLDTPGGELTVQRRNGPEMPPHVRLLAHVQGQLPVGVSPLPQLEATSELAIN
jgi:hypothetical protein